MRSPEFSVSPKVLTATARTVEVGTPIALAFAQTLNATPVSAEPLADVLQAPDPINCTVGINFHSHLYKEGNGTSGYQPNESWYYWPFSMVLDGTDKVIEPGRARQYVFATADRSRSKIAVTDQLGNGVDQFTRKAKIELSGASDIKIPPHPPETELDGMQVVVMDTGTGNAETRVAVCGKTIEMDDYVNIDRANLHDMEKTIVAENDPHTWRTFLLGALTGGVSFLAVHTLYHRLVPAPVRAMIGISRRAGHVRDAIGRGFGRIGRGIAGAAGAGAAAGAAAGGAATGAGAAAGAGATRTRRFDRIRSFFGR
jgi:hypothetical protein